MRKIIHIDLDCFYAAIEMRDNPEYRNVPLAIGGTTDRGVISTCNYIAREYGVRSAMSSVKARQLCPNLVMIKGNMDKYVEASNQFRDILRRYSDKIEPLSLDEAYIDVSDSEQFHGSATLIAEQIRKEVFEEIGITASAGVAPVKFIAKIASDENKPNGICVVPPDKVQAFLLPMSLKKIPGIGKVGFKRLNSKGLYTCEDVLKRDPNELIKTLGKTGLMLIRRAQGIDNSEVRTSRKRKSIGAERTFLQDLRSYEECEEKLDSLLERLESRIDKANKRTEIKALGVKVKFADFTQTTVEQQGKIVDKAAYIALLKQGLARSPDKQVRLLGVNVTLDPDSKKQQLSLSF